MPPAEAQPLAPLTQLPLTPPPKTAKEEVRAALLVPLSGANGALGAMLTNAAQLALFDTADQHFNLIPLDTHGTTDGAAAAAHQAVAQGADIILGPLFSAEVKAVAPVAHDAGIPVVAFTTDRNALGNGIYSLGFLPGAQVKRVVVQAMAENRSRFAVLAPNTDYGHAMADAMKQAVGESGARLVRTEFYDPAATDFTAIAKRFAEYDRHRNELARDKTALGGRGGSQKALAAAEAASARMPYDAVLLPDEGVRLKSIASLVTYYGLDPGPVRFLGTMLWDDPRLADEPSLQGGWFAAPPTAGHGDFEAHYLKSFGPLPARFGSLASTAYDATALAAALAHRSPGGDYSMAALTAPDGFAGVDGIFRLMPDGTSERGLAVRELVRGGAKEVSPAPTTFPPVAPTPQGAMMAPAPQGAMMAPTPQDAIRSGVPPLGH